MYTVNTFLPVKYFIYKKKKREKLYLFHRILEQKKQKNLVVLMFKLNLCIVVGNTSDAITVDEKKISFWFKNKTKKKKAINFNDPYHLILTCKLLFFLVLI